MAKPGNTRGRMRALVAAAVLCALIVAAASSSAAIAAAAAGRTSDTAGAAAHQRRPHAAAVWPRPSSLRTTTPIKHLVVLFQENVSFDKYFGTYPYALNPPGEPRFVAAPDTPSVNGLTPALLLDNPNGVNPVRLEPDTGNACGSNHSYLNEQEAFDHGLMDESVPF